MSDFGNSKIRNREMRNRKIVSIDSHLRREEDGKEKQNMNEKNQSVWMEENRSNREDSSWTKESGDSTNSLKTDDNVSPDISAAQEASVARGAETKADNAEECRREAQTPLEHGAIVGTAMSPGNVSPSQGSPMSSGSVSSSQGSPMQSGSVSSSQGSPMQ